MDDGLISMRQVKYKENVMSILKDNHSKFQSNMNKK